MFQTLEINLESCSGLEPPHLMICLPTYSSWSSTSSSSSKMVVVVKREERQAFSEIDRVEEKAITEWLCCCDKITTH